MDLGEIVQRTNSVVAREFELELSTLKPASTLYDELGLDSLDSVDLVAALVTVSMEEESLSLVPMALIYRFVFILFLDVVKMFATLEELFRLDMGWGKLERLEST